MFSSGMSFGSNFGGFGGGAPTASEPLTGLSQAGPEAGSAAKKPRQEAKETCLPVTIRAIEAALERRGESGDDLKFYGVAEPQMILVVAAIESVVRQAASLEVSLNDATGSIKGRWFLTEPQEGELEGIAPGCFVSLFGEVRASPVKHIAIKGMRPVESADEVSYHIIEAAHAALRLQRGGARKDQEPATPAKAKEQLGGAVAMTGGFTPEKTQQMPMESVEEAVAAASVAAEKPGGGVPAATAAVPPQGPPSGAELRATVLRLLRAPAMGPEGLHLSDLAAKAGGAAPSEVKAAVSDLVEDGELYNTITEEHFAAV